MWLYDGEPDHICLGVKDASPHEGHKQPQPRPLATSSTCINSPSRKAKVII